MVLIFKLMLCIRTSWLMIGSGRASGSAGVSTKFSRSGGSLTLSVIAKPTSSSSLLLVKIPAKNIKDVILPVQEALLCIPFDAEEELLSVKADFVLHECKCLLRPTKFLKASLQNAQNTCNKIFLCFCIEINGILGGGGREDECVLFKQNIIICIYIDRYIEKQSGCLNFHKKRHVNLK